MKNLRQIAQNAGFSLLEILVALGLATSTLLIVAMLNSEVITAYNTVNFKTGMIEVNAAMLRQLTDPTKCTAAVAKIPLDLVAAKSPLGLSFQITTPDLGMVSAGLKMPTFHLKVERLSLTNALDLGVDKTSGNQLYSVILTAQYSAINQVKGSSVSPVQLVASFTLGTTATPSHTIINCMMAEIDPIKQCAAANKIFFNQPLNGFLPDGSGCMDPAALAAGAPAGPVGAPGAAGAPGVPGADGAAGAPSDARLKVEVQPFEYGLTELIDVRPIWFRYNGLASTPKGELHAGVLAQELLVVAPKLVESHPALLNVGDPTYTSVLSVRYSDFDMMIVKAIQQQHMQITEIKKQLTQFNY